MTVFAMAPDGVVDTPHERSKTKCMHDSYKSFESTYLRQCMEVLAVTNSTLTSNTQEQLTAGLSVQVCCKAYYIFNYILLLYFNLMNVGQSAKAKEKIRVI